MNISLTGLAVWACGVFAWAFFSEMFGSRKR